MWVGTGYAFTLDGADRLNWPSEDGSMSDVKDRRQFDWNRRPFSALNSRPCRPVARCCLVGQERRCVSVETEMRRAPALARGCPSV